MARIFAHVLVCIASPVLMLVYARNSLKKLDQDLVHVEIEGLSWESLGH
jgi:hypothetical protein